MNRELANAIGCALCLAGALVAPRPAWAAETQWKTLTSKEGRFSALMPGKPKETTTQQSGITAYLFSVETGDNKLFQVVYHDLKDQSAEPAPNSRDRALRAFRDTFYKGKTIVSDKSITLRQLPGLDFVLKGQDKAAAVTIRERMFLAWPRIYQCQVASLGDESFVTSADAEQFLNSFEVVDKPTTKTSDETPPAEKPFIVPPPTEFMHMATAPRADGTKFQTFVSAEGRFTVEMPGKATESTQKTTNGAVIHYAIFKSIIERYQVVYFDVPESVVRGNEPQKILKAYPSGEYPDKKLQGEKEVRFGKDKSPGIEYRVETVFENGKGRVPIFIRERVILVGSRLYVLQFRALVNKNLLDTKEATRFFDSFAITK